MNSGMFQHFKNVLIVPESFSLLIPKNFFNKKIHYVNKFLIYKSNCIAHLSNILLLYVFVNIENLTAALIFSLTYVFCFSLKI